jgi:hypothetical protein
MINACLEVKSSIVILSRTSINMFHFDVYTVFVGRQEAVTWARVFWGSQIDEVASQESRENGDGGMASVGFLHHSLI